MSCLIFGCTVVLGLKLRATITRTAYYYRGFTVSGLNLWNSLPNYIKECASLSSFKQSLYNDMVTKPQF